MHHHIRCITLVCLSSKHISLQMTVLGLVELKFTFEVVHWHRSELAQKVDTEDLAESFMAFNTNYRDSGLFGIYAIAKVQS